MTTPQWHRLKEEDLLERRITDLNLQIAGTGIAPLIQKLYQELQDKGLTFNPPCFLADEWHCPVGVPAIGIPFYLAHPRLKKLEDKHILEVEGGSKTEFMKLIRHEAAHAYSYAYNLYKRPKWQRHFGLASQKYEDTYKPRPYSRSFVIHLDNWYAQSHPDEDFAESFAVWLTPNINWKRRYRNWKALKKLECVESLTNSIQGKKPKRPAIFNPTEYSNLNIKLKTYYRQKKKDFEESYPDFYDKDLKSLFTDDSEKHSDQKAARYLRQSRKKLLKCVAHWTKEKKYTIDQLINSFIERTEALNLYVRKDKDDLDAQTASFITTLVSNYLFTGKFKRFK